MPVEPDRSDFWIPWMPHCYSPPKWRGRSFLPPSHALPSHESGLSHVLRCCARNAPVAIPSHRTHTCSLYRVMGIITHRDSPLLAGFPEQCGLLGTSRCRGPKTEATVEGAVNHQRPQHEHAVAFVTPAFAGGRSFLPASACLHADPAISSPQGGVPCMVCEPSPWS